MNTPENKKHVVSLYYKHKAGGFTTRLYKAWMGLANAGYQVTYIATERLPVEHKNIHPCLIRCRSSQGSALFWLEYFIRSVFTARHVAKKNKAPCFMVFSFFYGALAVLAGFGMEIKTIVFIRGDDLHDSRFKSHAKIRVTIHRLLEKFSIRYSALIVATNKHMMETLKERNKPYFPIDFLPNNIVNADQQYTKNKLSTEDGMYRFVAVSVLNERKNILYALQAMANMRVLNWQFLVIGADVENTGYGKKLEAFIAQNNLHYKVRMLGWQENVLETVSQCDLFIIPTTMEGSPNALLEALGTHISCIGSNIPEVAELLDDPRMVFNLKDPASLTQQLDQFCSDPAYRDQLAVLSSQSRERYVFNWESRIIEFIEGSQPRSPTKTIPSQHVKSSL